MEALSWHTVVIVLALCALSATGMICVYRCLRAREKGFGPITLKAFAICLLLPCLAIATLLVHEHSEAVFAILGTIAGYILSSSQEST